MSSDLPSKEGLPRHDTKSGARPPPPNISVWDRLPLWMANNLRSKKSWKVLLRCWVASWACFVIMLPIKSLKVLGNA